MNQIYKYNGTEITFHLGDGSVMVNATEMAKPFGNTKRPQFWLSTSYADCYMEELAKARILAYDDLVQVIKGGNNPGTWMHEDIAIEFARWLSPAFAIWCNDKVKELLTKGYTKLDSITRKDLAKWLLESEEEKEKALEAVNILTEKIETDRPKIIFADSVSGSENLILIREYAKILSDQGFVTGEKRLYTWFRENGFLNRRNEPYQEYIDMGLFKVIERSYGGPEGTFTCNTTKITGKGQLYFAGKIKQLAL